MTARRERMHLKSVRLSDGLIKESERLVEKEGWKDWSEFIRAAIRAFVEDKKEMDGQ